MNRDLHPAVVYRFADLEINCPEFRVLKGGVPQKITPRAFEVLVFLIERPGRLVSKQELFEEIWKESFVTDNALTRMIKEIRRVIGDDADAPQHIETIPKRGYRFIAEVRRSEEDQPTRPLVVRTEKAQPSIAVLPFINIGDDADHEYLSEGITESLINNLSQISDLRVVPRSTVYYFQGRETEPLRIGQKLNVQKVLTGQVRQRQDQLIVSTELIDVPKQAQIWGEQYYRPLSGIIDLQQQISQKIFAELRLKLNPERQKQLIQEPTRDSEAYQLYLKGRYFWNRRPQGLFKGIEYFERALGEDENFALAYAGLADSYSTLGSWENGSLAPKVAMPKACAAAAKALEINPNLAEAHTTLAYTKFHYDYNFAEAETGFHHALELNKNYVHAHHWLSHVYMARGETEKSLTASRHALELDPLDLIINVHQAWHFWLARQPDEAISQAEKTRELDAGVIWSSFFAGLALAEQEMFDAAVAELRRAQKLSPGLALVQSALGNLLGLCGQRKEARSILAELERERANKFVPAYDIALVRIGLGDLAGGLDWLYQAAAEHSGWLPYLGVEPRLDPVRQMPEFQKLLVRVGLTS
jgi:TolB-like protein/Tfp pilus assembly protein PilF